LIAENQVMPAVVTRAWIKNLAWHLLPPGVYLLFLLRWYPHWNNIWLFSDEGFNLMKALLVARGYTLYNQIWSDQPPLLTDLLALLFRIHGGIIQLLLICLFLCAIWALVQFLRLAWGDPAALAGAFLIIVLPSFIPLSAAVLVGQPSLALAAVSLVALAAWHRRRWQIFLVLSALALATSILIKLFTAFLAPIFLAGLLAAEFFPLGKPGGWRARIRPAGVWLVVFASVSLLAGFALAGPASLPQLVGTPWAASQATQYPPNDQIFPITHHLRDSWATLLLAGLGALLVFQQRRWLMLYPLAWAVFAFISLLNLTPVWFHHQLLVTIPAALLAAGAVAETARLAAAAIRPRPPSQLNWPVVAACLRAARPAAGRSQPHPRHGSNFPAAEHRGPGPERL
jgi:hypothetical protein